MAPADETPRTSLATAAASDGQPPPNNNAAVAGDNGGGDDYRDAGTMTNGGAQRTYFAGVAPLPPVPDIMWRPASDHGDINPGTNHGQTLFMKTAKGLPIDQQLDLTRSRRIQPHATVTTTRAKFNNMKVNGDWSKFDSRDAQILALATKINELTFFNVTALVAYSNSSRDDLRRMMVLCLQKGEFLELKLPGTGQNLRANALRSMAKRIGFCRNHKLEGKWDGLCCWHHPSKCPLIKNKDGSVDSGGQPA